MNRIAILAAVAAPILLLPPHASAQVGIAITGGVNYGSFSGPPESDFTSLRRGFSGLALTVPLLRNLEIELGGAFTQKGGQTIAEGGGTMRFDLSYRELTLKGKVSLPLANDRIRVFLTAGPAIALARKDACNVKLSDPRGGHHVVRCALDDFHDRDYSLAGGGGIDLKLSKGFGVTLGATHTYGLTNIAQRDDVGEWKHRTTSLRTGFQFWIG